MLIKADMHNVSSLALFFHFKLLAVVFYYFIVLLLFLGGCTTKEIVRQQEVANGLQSSLPKITSIHASENKLIIIAEKPFEYTIYKPDDPFKVVVELNGVIPVKGVEQIDTSGTDISEIKIQHIKTPIEGTRIELLLASPVGVVPEYSEGILRLVIEEGSQESPLLENVISKTIGTSDMPLDANAEETSIGLTAAMHIRDISLEEQEDRVLVSISGDGKMSPEVFSLDDILVIDVPGVDMKAAVPEGMIRPLRDIRWGKYDAKVRIILELESHTSSEVVTSGDSIEVSLVSPGLMKEIEVEKREKQPEQKEVIKEIKGGVALKEKMLGMPEGIPSGAGFTGKRISLDFQDADIIPIFRLFADVSGFNLIVDPNVKGKITMKMIDVPWDQALDLILKTHNLDKKVEGSVIRIAPMSFLAKEGEETLRAKEAAEKAEPLVTQIFPISYENVNNVKVAVEGANILSSRGNVSINERISSLIVKDIQSNIPKISEIIKILDKATPQVMIEARIVEVNTNASSEFGIQWGASATSSNRLTSFGGLSSLTPGANSGNPFIVDFPAAAGVGAGTGIAFGFLNAARTLTLDLQLSALESVGNGKIISKPRIVTINNKEAKILQGKKIPYQTVENGETKTAFQDVNLALVVTPHITPDDSIILSVNVKKDELDWANAVAGQPATDTKEATTNVIIENSETFVIGGIYKTINSGSESGVPLLSAIPVLGNLFKYQRKEETVNELLIFITPRIVIKSE